jgi:hypothetical protein
MFLSLLNKERIKVFGCFGVIAVEQFFHFYWLYSKFLWLLSNMNCQVSCKSCMGGRSFNVKLLFMWVNVSGKVRHALDWVPSVIPRCKRKRLGTQAGHASNLCRCQMQ